MLRLTRVLFAVVFGLLMAAGLGYHVDRNCSTETVRRRRRGHQKCDRLVQGRGKGQENPVSCEPRIPQRLRHRDDQKQSNESLARDRDRGTGLRDLLLVQFGLVLLDKTFEARNILQKPFAGQAQQIIAKFGILKVKLEQRLIRDCQDVSALDAFHRLGAFVLWRDKARARP